MAETECIRIEGEEWPIRFLPVEYIGRISRGDVTAVDDVLEHPWSPEILRGEEYPENPLAPLIYEAHLIAAAFGQVEVARMFYERGKLDKVTWLSSSLEYPSRVCPVCFKLTDAAGDYPDCAGRHLVFSLRSDLQSYELKGEREEEIGESIFSNLFSESGNFDDLKETLFSDDVVGRALRRAADEELWFTELPGGEMLRIFSETCDEDRWGDTFTWGYHPEGSRFVDVIMDYYQQMIERCQECGLDACDDY